MQHAVSIIILVMWKRIVKCITVSNRCEICRYWNLLDAIFQHL